CVNPLWLTAKGTSNRPSLFFACETLLAPRISSCVTGDGRIRTEWPGLIRKGLAARDDAFGCAPVLHPLLDRRQHVELVRGGPPRAMSHPGYEKEAGPHLHVSAVGPLQAIVPGGRVQGGESLVAQTVVEDELAAAREAR